MSLYLAYIHIVGQLKRGRSTGLEPATSGTTIQCSNQLSYDRHKIEPESLLEERILRQMSRYLKNFFHRKGNSNKKAHYDQKAQIAQQNKNPVVL